MTRLTLGFLALLLLLVPRAARAEDESQHESSAKPPFVLDVGGIGSVQELRLARGNDFDKAADRMALGFADDGGGATFGAGVTPVHAGQFGAMMRARYIYARPMDLAAHFVSLGGEGIFAATSAVRIVGGAHASWLALVRATTGDLVQHWGVGATLGLDLVPLSSSAGSQIYLRPEATATVIPHMLMNPWSLAWGGTLTVGARFSMM